MPEPAMEAHKQPAAPATAEEEALKRNTDCVYFLASPLTCKKGNECEYRHSEYARVNPRDCYYWLNGSCLNPKCGFRHPPLDGLIGSQGPVSAAPIHAHAHHHHHSGGKVPCVFFQKGLCIKGDRCAFLHVPKAAAVEITPVADPLSSKKPLEKVAEEKKRFPSANLSKVVTAHVDSARVSLKASNDGVGDSRRSLGQHVGYETGLQREVAAVPLYTEERGHSTQLIQTRGSDDTNSFRNGKDPDDVLRESSPGFDVLVDDKLRDSEYYRGEDQYGGRRGEDVDFNAVADDDDDDDNNDHHLVEAFRDYRDFDSYDHMEDKRYGWAHHRASSEREDRVERRDKWSEHVPESDLRHRLKHRRGDDGLRSGGSRDYLESRREKKKEISISTRLQGRIRVPERVKREGDGHGERGRQGRLRDRIKGRVEESYGDGHRARGSVTRRDIEDDDMKVEFSNSRKEESKGETFLRKRKSLEDHGESEDSFAAPLPFSEILKRKRAAAAASGAHGDEVSRKPRGMKEEPQDAPMAVVEIGDEAELTVEDKEEDVNGAVVGEGGMVEDNGEYYYEEGYEEDGEYYTYEEGEEGAEEAAGEGDQEEEEGGNEFAKKIGVML